jgi:hypothetical protein
MPCTVLSGCETVASKSLIMAETSGAPVDGPESEVETNWDEATPSFDLMDLKEELLRVSLAHHPRLTSEAE